MEEGWGDPRISGMARLELVLRGIKIGQAGKSTRKGERLPITQEVLVKLRRAWAMGTMDNKEDRGMLWAAAALCFFGFFRSGEITIPSEAGFDEGAHLTFADVTVDSTKEPKMLRVRVKASKTDPFREGVDVYVGKTDSELCPVTAVLRFMVERGAGPGPFFRFQDGTPLTRQKFVEKVKLALTSVGVDSTHYSGHSFRSGAATTAARRGIGDATIKTLGRWKSRAYQLYVKTPRQQLATYSWQLGQPGLSSE